MSAPHLAVGCSPYILIAPSRLSHLVSSCRFVAALPIALVCGKIPVLRLRLDSPDAQLSGEFARSSLELFFLAISVGIIATNARGRQFRGGRHRPENPIPAIGHKLLNVGGAILRLPALFKRYSSR
jgi:hypothetical protein